MLHNKLSLLYAKRNCLLIYLHNYDSVSMCDGLAMDQVHLALPATLSKSSLSFLVYLA